MQRAKKPSQRTAVAAKPKHATHVRVAAKVTAPKRNPNRAQATAVVAPAKATSTAAIESPLVKIALDHLGKNPTGWSHQWCAKFLGTMLQKAGYSGGGNLARGYASYGKPSPARVGAIAVMSHHVGIVTEVGKGYVTLVSGNNHGRPGRRVVGVSRYPVGRIMAFRMPS